MYQLWSAVEWWGQGKFRLGHWSAAVTKGQRKHILAAGVGGVTVSIVAFQAVDPGSTPGQRILFCLIPVGVV